MDGGITPACAGKRLTEIANELNLRDHPRVCGEKEMLAFRAQAWWGSPPRVRGKAQLFGFGFYYCGITPACAGKSLVRFKNGQITRDHPRVCGEKWLNFSRCSFIMGSPPRVRGKGFCSSALTSFFGITPACAGKRVSPLSRNRGHGDHPRVCGEKLAMLDEIYHAMGSPPRVRGKGPPQLLRCGVKGITPACAGKSLTIQKMTTRSRDHPRVCGEKNTTRHLFRRCLGSPPRVRGKVGRHKPNAVILGITPACAGKSIPERREVLHRGDHPRVCGEKANLLRGQRLHLGSPPRVRGKADHASPAGSAPGITPACAGKRRAHCSIRSSD